LTRFHCDRIHRVIFTAAEVRGRQDGPGICVEFRDPDVGVVAGRVLLRLVRTKRCRHFRAAGRGCDVDVRLMINRDVRHGAGEAVDEFKLAVHVDFCDERIKDGATKRFAKGEKRRVGGTCVIQREAYQAEAVRVPHALGVEHRQYCVELGQSLVRQSGDVQDLGTGQRQVGTIGQLQRRGFECLENNHRQAIGSQPHGVSARFGILLVIPLRRRTENRRVLGYALGIELRHERANRATVRSFTILPRKARRLRRADYVCVAMCIDGNVVREVVASAAKVGRVGDDRVNHERKSWIVLADGKSHCAVAAHYICAVDGPLSRASLLVNDRSTLDELVVSGANDQVARIIDSDSVVARIDHHDLRRIRARLDDPVEFQLTRPLVELEVDSSVDVVVPHTFIAGHAGVPGRRVAAGDIVGHAGQAMYTLDDCAAAALPRDAHARCLRVITRCSAEPSVTKLQQRTIAGQRQAEIGALRGIDDIGRQLTFIWLKY